MLTKNTQINRGQVWEMPVFLPLGKDMKLVVLAILTLMMYMYMWP